MNQPEPWPSLPYDAWADTATTLHLWTQIVGKIRAAQTPWINHSWHVPLYVTPRGLTTSSISCDTRSFSLDFDFIAHDLIIAVSDGSGARLPLKPQSVAAFHDALFTRLNELGLVITIHPHPNEVADPIPFEEDETHQAYDPDYAASFWRVLARSHHVLQRFRARFIGKCSPVHFFWGSFDLAVTRFSGRLAPPHPGGIPNLPDWITREAYSHEVSSAGFWPGSEDQDALFYSYAYPEPDGFREATFPEGTFYSDELSEFVLPYATLREAASPDELLLEFLQATYEAAADTGGWDRSALERSEDPRLEHGEPPP